MVEAKAAAAAAAGGAGAEQPANDDDDDKGSSEPPSPANGAQAAAPASAAAAGVGPAQLEEQARLLREDYARMEAKLRAMELALNAATAAGTVGAEASPVPGAVDGGEGVAAWSGVTASDEHE
jgi:hypothetical protein